MIVRSQHPERSIELIEVDAESKDAINKDCICQNRVLRLHCELEEIAILLSMLKLSFSA